MSYPTLYEIHARPWLVALGEGRPATLDDVPDVALDRIAGLGFDLLWLMGAWTTGEASRAVSRADPDALRVYREILPDFREADVCGSPYAVSAYEVHPDFGGDAALLRFRRRLAERGM